MNNKLLILASIINYIMFCQEYTNNFDYPYGQLQLKQKNIPEELENNAKRQKNSKSVIGYLKRSLAESQIIDTQIIRDLELAKYPQDTIIEVYSVKYQELIGLVSRSGPSMKQLHWNGYVYLNNVYDIGYILEKLGNITTFQGIQIPSITYYSFDRLGWDHGNDFLEKPLKYTSYEQVVQEVNFMKDFVEALGL